MEGQLLWVFSADLMTPCVIKENTGQNVGVILEVSNHHQKERCEQ